MKKLILAMAALALSSSAFAQTDTFRAKGVSTTLYYNGYNNGFNQGTLPNVADMNSLNGDTVPKGKLKKKMPKGKHIKPMPPDSAHFGMQNDKMKHQMMDKSTQKHEMMNMSKEKHVMMQDGKVTIMRKGKMTIVKAYTPLSNGTRVMSDGTIIKKDGTKTMLKEGECLNMAGEMVPMKN